MDVHLELFQIFQIDWILFAHWPFETTIVEHDSILKAKSKETNWMLNAMKTYASVFT